MKFIAHRGLAEHFPENSLLAIRAALACGAHAIECDLQLSADKRFYLLHDQDFQRTAGLDRLIANTQSADLAALSVHEPDRFGGRYQPCLLSELNALLALVPEYPKVKFFIELKTEIFQRVSRQETLELLLAELDVHLAKSYHQQLSIISYDQEFIALLQNLSLARGWVLTRFDQASLVIANKIKPDYLICNQRKVDAELWPGPWQWVIYDIVDVHVAKTWQQRGADWIESWDVCQLLKDWRAHEL